MVATSTTSGIVRESTGKYFSSLYPVNSVENISNFINLNNFKNIISDTLANSNLQNSYCNNPDGSSIFLHLTNDYSKDCSPFAVNGPVYSVYHDSVDNVIYASGSFTVVNGNTRNQIVKFNYNGVYD